MPLPARNLPLLPACPAVASFPVSSWGILNLGSSTVLGRWRAPLWLRKVKSLKDDSLAWAGLLSARVLGPWLLALCGNLSRAPCDLSPGVLAWRSAEGQEGPGRPRRACRARIHVLLSVGFLLPLAFPPGAGFACLALSVGPGVRGAAPCQCWHGRPRSCGCSFTPLGVSCVWCESSWLLVRGLQHPALLLPGLCIRAGPPDCAALASSWCLCPSRDPAEPAVWAPWFPAPLSHTHTALGSVNVQCIVPKRQRPSLQLKTPDC